MELIPNWQDKDYGCYFCGETRSVKYMLEIINPVDSDKPIKVPVCNKCALRYADKEKK